MNFSAKDAYTVMLKGYDQMAQILGISKKTGYKLLQNGTIFSMKIGRCYRIPKVHLLAYLKIGAET